MRKVLFVVWVLDVEVDGDEVTLPVILQKIASFDSPGAFVFFAFFPPGQAVSELLKLNRCSFRVLLAPLGERLFVIPDFFSWTRSFEKEQIRRDAGVRGKNAVGQADNCMKVELLE